jgi:hypothetical protein
MLHRPTAARKGIPVRRLLNDALRTLVPPRDDNHGSLPPLLLTLTVATGLVDAVSYLVLGLVFVANTTGNVVFLGFALVGAANLSVFASVVALAAFLRILSVLAMFLGDFFGAELVLHGHLEGRGFSITDGLAAGNSRVAW